MDLAGWGELEVRRLVGEFVSKRFPMVLLLNKADPAATLQAAGGGGGGSGGGGGLGDLDRNLTRVVERYEPRGLPCIVGSAAAELFLRQVAPHTPLRATCQWWGPRRKRGGLPPLSLLWRASNSCEPHGRRNNAPRRGPESSSVTRTALRPSARLRTN